MDEAQRLRAYRAKRDFAATREPAGAGVGAAQPPVDAPRFVVQQHDASHLHWDLRLERDGTLASWALPRGAPLDPHDDRAAIRTEDHPLEYLDFHGEIPAGSYGAGTMEILDAGTYETHEWTDRKVEVTLRGERLRGRYGLFPLTGRAAGRAERAEAGTPWMIHRLDPPSDPRRTPLPPHLAPMLAREGDDGPLPGGDERWAHEVLWDGVRALLWSDHGHVRMEDRTGRDLTARCPELRALGRALGARELLLDGVLVALDEHGRPSAERLRPRLEAEGERAIRRAAAAQPAMYMAFDLLQLDGRPLLELPYERRRALLDELALDGPGWRTPRCQRDGGALRAAAREQGLAGTVAKRLDAPYEPGRRSGAWRALRERPRREPALAARIGRELPIAHPGEVLFPASGFTKGDLVAYYAAIAPTLLAHLRDRPLALRSWPAQRPDWVQTVSVYSARERRRVDRCLAQDAATLAWLGGQAEIELRPALHRARDPEHPTAVVLDLDPAPPAGLQACAEVALVLHGLFERLGLLSVVMTSGGTGLQVRLPLGARAASYARARPFAQRVAALLEQHLPELVVARATERPRAGKVLVDWSRNDPGETTIAGYSLRAGRGPVVATPLAWEELRAAHAAGAADRLVFDPAAALARVEEHGDLLAPLLSARQRLPVL